MEASDILNGILKQNQQLADSYNKHSEIIKELIQRISFLETEIIEMRRRGAMGNGGPVAGQTPVGRDPAFQTTQAYVHLNNLGVFNGPGGINI